MNICIYIVYCVATNNLADYDCDDFSRLVLVDGSCAHLLNANLLTTVNNYKHRAAG